MERLSIEQYYLNIAKEVSKRSTCVKRQYGAIIVNNDEIIATGYNGAPRGVLNCSDIGKCPRISVPHNSGDYSNCAAVHAEQNALLSASRKEIIGGTLYLWGRENDKDVDDVAPCPVCMKMIINSGITSIVTKNSTIPVADAIRKYNTQKLGDLSAEK